MLAPRAGITRLLLFLSSHPVDLICIQESTLTHLPLSRSLDSLLCILIAPTPGLAFSLVIPRTLAEASSFSSGRACPSLNFLSPLSPGLTSYTDYVGVNISLNNSSLLYFLNVYALPIRSSSMDGRRLFFLHLSLLQKSLHSGEFQLPSSPLGLKSTSDSRGEEVFNWVISSDLLFFSMTLTYLLFSIASLAVAPSLKFPLLPPLSPFLAHGRCFRTWALITYQFFYLSLFPRFFAPTSVPPFQFSKSSLG